MPVIIEWIQETNHPPVATVHIDPSPTCVETETLVLTYTYYDPDGDPELGSLIYWFRNAKHVAALDGLRQVSHTYLNAGQYWYVMARPRDNKGLWGDWAISNVVWIVASPGVGYLPPGVYPTFTRPEDIGNV